MRRVTAALAAVVLAVGACSDDGDDTAASTTTEATTTTTEATTTTTQAPACPPVSVPDGAQEVTELDGDADGDGDGTGDELRTYRVGEEWHLQVELAADGGADLVLPSFGGGVGLVGGADVDGDGLDEVWARTGSGASATIVGLARMADCALERVVFATGELAELPIGGSVGTTSGLECRDDALTTFTASLTDDGETYEVVATTYALDGVTLTEQGQETTQVAATDPDFIRYTSFSCADLSL